MHMWHLFWPLEGHFFLVEGSPILERAVIISVFQQESESYTVFWGWIVFSLQRNCCFPSELYKIGKKNVGGKAVIKCIASNYRQKTLSFHYLRGHTDRRTLTFTSVWKLCKLTYIFEFSTCPLPKALIILYQEPLNLCSGMHFHLCACIKA